MRDLHRLFLSLFPSTLCVSACVLESQISRSLPRAFARATQPSPLAPSSRTIVSLSLSHSVTTDAATLTGKRSSITSPSTTPAICKSVLLPCSRSLVVVVVIERLPSLVLSCDSCRRSRSSSGSRCSRLVKKKQKQLLLSRNSVRLSHSLRSPQQQRQQKASHSFAHLTLEIVSPALCLLSCRRFSLSPLYRKGVHISRSTLLGPSSVTELCRRSNPLICLSVFPRSTTFCHNANRQAYTHIRIPVVS